MDIPETIETHNGAWTVNALAQLLGVSTKLLYKLIRQGRLPAFRIGTLVRLNPKTTGEWFRSQQTDSCLKS